MGAVHQGFHIRNANHIDALIVCKVRLKVYKFIVMLNMLNMHFMAFMSILQFMSFMSIILRTRLATNPCQRWLLMPALRGR